VDRRRLHRSREPLLTCSPTYAFGRGWQTQGLDLAGGSAARVGVLGCGEGSGTSVTELRPAAVGAMGSDERVGRSLGFAASGAGAQEARQLARRLAGTILLTGGDHTAILS
jgi:hypothetical protein